MHKKLTTILLLTLTMLAPNSAATAQESTTAPVIGADEDAGEAYDEVKQQQKHVEEELVHLHTSEDGLQMQSALLALSINTKELSVASLFQKVQEAKETSAQAQQNVVEAQKEVIEQEKLIESRVVAAYISPETRSEVDALLSSETANEYEESVHLIDRVGEFDDNVLIELGKAKENLLNLQAIAEEKTKVAKEIQIDAEKKLDELALQEIEQQELEVELDETIQEIIAESEALEEEEEAILEIISQRLEEEKRLSEEEVKIVIESTSGDFIWPVDAKVGSPFGYRLHPISRTWKLHAGHDMGARSGTVIKASASGTVIYAGWRGGYGNTVMIDHGAGLVTLYAHQSKLNVSLNQVVSVGQTIGYVGSTGYSTGPHLHFETRLNGTPVDPYTYLP